MDKMPENGINMRKSVAMGMHEAKYGRGGYGKPTKKARGRHPDRESAAEDRTESAADEAAESYSTRLY